MSVRILIDYYSEIFSQVVQQCKEVLLLTATPDAMLRLDNFAHDAHEVEMLK
jgi:hypothetical protein